MFIAPGDMSLTYLNAFRKGVFKGETESPGFRQRLFGCQAHASLAQIKCAATDDCNMCGCKMRGGSFRLHKLDKGDSVRGCHPIISPAVLPVIFSRRKMVCLQRVLPALGVMEGIAIDFDMIIEGNEETFLAKLAFHGLH